MSISYYWTGQIPQRPMVIDVNGSDGRPANLAGYTNYEVIVLGSDNEPVDMTGAQLQTAQASSGRLVFRWPSDRSVFTKTGEYLLQLKLTSDTSRDFTSVHHIFVRELGGVD
jgi:hypothetical protein